MTHKEDDILHVPVLFSEIQEYVKKTSGEEKEYICFDGTLGLGGHAHIFLQDIPQSHLYASDLDKNHIMYSKKRLLKYKDRTTFFHNNFATAMNLCQQKGICFDYIFLDLGLASPHLDNPDRGFSYKTSSLLDMRFDSDQTDMAGSLLQKMDAKSLADIFFYYGDITGSRKLAQMIIQKRKRIDIQRIDTFTSLVFDVFGEGLGKKLLPQIFQSLRIAVNDEYTCLKNMLNNICPVLNKGGHLIVISYHSLEDRLVKNCIRDHKRDDLCKLSAFQKKPLSPSSIEILKNPRSRSAKLRIAQRI
jgi:16S rRNA (cytosine1402-N4)-methyltransferase